VCLGAVSDSSKSNVAVAGVGPILLRSCSAHCPTGLKPELSDQSGPHPPPPPPGAWPLPPPSAWGTVPLGPTLLTVPLDISQSSPTKWAYSSSWSLSAVPSVCRGSSTTWSCSAHCPTGHKPELSDPNGPHPPPGAWLLPPLSAWGAAPLAPFLSSAS